MSTEFNESHAYIGDCGDHSGDFGYHQRVAWIGVILMARGRQPRDPGPPGLGGYVTGPASGTPRDVVAEQLADIADSANSSGTNHEPETESATRNHGREEISYQGIRFEPDHNPPLGITTRETVERLETLWSEFLDQNAVVEQTNSQLRALEQSVSQGMTLLEQCKNAIITLEQRLNALGQQTVQTNTRIAAAQLAIQGKASHDGGNKLVEQAEQWYQFLLRDLVVKVAPPQVEEVKSPDGVDPENTTQH